jgi:internalin A
MAMKPLPEQSGQTLESAQDKAERLIREAADSGAARALFLDGLELKALPESLSRLTQLRHLIVAGNQLTALPVWLGQLKQLEYLNVSSNQLTGLPDWLGRLKRLQSLNVSFNRLTSLPEALGQLTQLQSLGISSNRLSGLPEALGQLTRLQSLVVAHNQLRGLPEALGQLTRLQSLVVSDNQLRGLPEALGQLTQLKSLSMAMNELVSLPPWLDQYCELEELTFARNPVKELPNWIGKLSNLRSLCLENTSIAVLPDALGELTKLEYLAIGNCGLRQLPTSIGNLTALKGLHASNEGGIVYRWRGSSSSWASPEARRNPATSLQTLPESLKQLKSLRELYLHGNESLGLPQELLGPTWHQVNSRAGKDPANPAAILDYYFSTRGAEGRALREVKLIVVGRGGVGKTSLINRLNELPLNLNESETHGIVISPLEFNRSDGPVTARVWDFGGQHVLHAMHEFFLTARSLYLLVLGAREDIAERDAAYWLQLIRSYAGRATVVVALNKCQGRPREIDRETLESNYGPVFAWVPTECDEKLRGSTETIGSLRVALTQAMDEMTGIRAVFPSKWWEIKEWLEKMAEPYLDYATYQERCRALGESNGANQEQLSEWLHDLGVALNYSRDPRLHDTTVLRPDWLANGIYALLRANDPRHPELLAPHAVLTAETLGPIYSAAEKLGMLKAGEYPREKWPFLLRLMGMFQLAYHLDERGQQLLVPALLPVEPPAGSEEPVSPDRTRLRYEFPVVPQPLLPRFLVRTSSLIENRRRWRRGAILRYGDARARIWATQDERWVHVTAAGDQGDRDELLTMIRRTLGELFTEYKDLPVVEQWEYEANWVPRKTLERMGVLSQEEGEGED